MLLPSFFSRHPEVKWAERVDKVYITVLLPDAINVKANLEPEGVFNFSATAGSDGNLYELKLDLHDKVNVEVSFGTITARKLHLEYALRRSFLHLCPFVSCQESKINIGVRNIFCVVEKAEKNWWKKLLRGDVKAPHYVKVDWDKWVDEDADNEGL